MVAVKIVKQENQEDHLRIFKEFRREVWLSSTLNHPCIVQLLGCSLKPLCLIMEYIPYSIA